MSTYNLTNAPAVQTMKIAKAKHSPKGIRSSDLYLGNSANIIPKPPPINTI